jgi:hypothetical protein
MADTAIEIGFSYLVFVGVATVLIAVSGQSLFGTAFPTNPFTSTTFTASSVTCASADWGCGVSATLNNLAMFIIVPVQIINYLWAIFIFFMVSPTLFWLGAVLFIPAGIVFLYLIYPILVDIAKIIVGIAQAIAEAIPF